MTYDDYCKGSASEDRSNTSYGGFQPDVYMDEAYAQRFVPSSRCLDSVTLRLKRYVDEDVYVEIKTDSGGKPSEMPERGYLGRYLIPYDSIPKSFTNINIPFGIIFDDAEPKWIVIYSRRYDPNYYDPLALFGLDGDKIESTTEYTAYSCGTCPDEGAWRTNTSVKLYFKTYKKTYTTSPPSCDFTVT